MKRSEINREIRKAEEFFASFQFKLPKFAYWSAEELQSRRHDEKYREIFDCNLGWDLTDFGTGNFEKEGLFLFTIRNGVVNDPAYPKPYAEKIMISRVNQVTLTHCHEYKREDIINRGGGKLAFELFNRKGDSPELDDTPVTVSKDGEKITVKAGEVLIRHGEHLIGHLEAAQQLVHGQIAPEQEHQQHGHQHQVQPPVLDDRQRDMAPGVLLHIIAHCLLRVFAVYTGCLIINEEIRRFRCHENQPP